jgi:hypothetical protein
MEVIRKDETKEGNLYSFEVVPQMSWIPGSPKHYRVNATIWISGKIYAYNFTDVYLTTFKCKIILQGYRILAMTSPNVRKLYCNQSEPCLVHLANWFAYDDPLCTP